MNSTGRTLGRFGRSVLGVLACVVAVGFLSGCPITDTRPDNQNDNTNVGDIADVTARIVSFSSSFGVSQLDPPLGVIYEITGEPDAITGFYVRVADATPGAASIEDRVVIATNLLPGSSQFFQFDPQAAGVGFYRVGVIVSVGTQELVVESQGVIQVQGPPNPCFIRPIDTCSDAAAGLVVEVIQGDEVFVSFDAGDPEGVVQWRAFFLSSLDSRTVLPDQLGTEMAVGSGNVGSTAFTSAGMQPGDYELGLSATDGGLSVASTVISGDASRIVTITGPVIRVLENLDIVPPTFSFSAPGSTAVELFKDDLYTLEFSATVSEVGATGEIELFYDDDATDSNGFTDTIVPGLPHTQTSYPFPTDLPDGEWFVGATLRTIGGVSAPVTRYASSSITVIRNPTLTITQPSSSLPVGPGTSVSISWTTNAPVSSGVLDVFAQAVDSSSGIDPTEIPLLTDQSISITSAQFSSVVSGVFQISARLEFYDGTTLTATAPARIRISSLPPILWLGDLAGATPEFEGAIFGGVNFEDNAGTTLTSAGDLDSDGDDEFVIGARYGKPFFVNPSGVGPGEAYLIHGGSGTAKMVGLYNLNSVGLTSLPGITLTGIRTQGDSVVTDGLSDVTLIPDADGDGKREMVFGFPRADSRSTGTLTLAGQFMRGGVVILSSDNDLLRDPSSGTPVINLDDVGQGFSDGSVPERQVELVLADLQTFEPGDLDATPPTFDACVEGNDSVMDTIIGPCIGFNDVLAPPAWQRIPPPDSFVWVNSPPAPQEELCPTQFDLTCAFAGSGFHPVDATSEEPKGARILGESIGDGFGTSITHSNSLGDSSSGDLIISSPNRTALGAVVNGIDSNVQDSGVSYMFDNLNLFSGSFLPSPHQFIIDTVSAIGAGRARTLISLRVVGAERDAIQNILGIDDFNGDGRNDFAIGAPSSGGGQGRVYIAYRRDGALEGDFVLGKLDRDPSDAERLDGMLIVSGTFDALGASLASGFDFNRDGFKDLAIGSPNADNGVGEVIIFFGNPGITSPLNGLPVFAQGQADLLSTSRTTDGGPVAVRISGNPLDLTGHFGFNIANAGDMDGDGFDDLLIAAPNASPRFDPDPNDTSDALTEAGLDLDFDGLKDDVSGPFGIRDGVVDDTFDNLPGSGIVYIVYGSNRLDLNPPTVNADITISIDQLGSNNLRGLMIVGWHGGDQLGGGDAGDVALGGSTTKLGRGRSAGLAGAGDVDGDNRADILIGSVLADPRRDPNTGVGVQNGGEAYLIYGSVIP